MHMLVLPFFDHLFNLVSTSHVLPVCSFEGTLQKVQVGICTHRKLRSDCISMQSDQSLRCVLYVRQKIY